MKSLPQKTLIGLLVLLCVACAKPKSQIDPLNGRLLTDESATKPIVKDSVEKKNVQIFDFYDITPPDMAFNFPSHSIVMIPVNVVGKDSGVANSFCEYWLYTKDEKLVCYCKNTMSGLHPVYGNMFNHNNHLPEFTKKIGYGDYRLVYKNISKVAVRQRLTFGLIINEGKDQINTNVDSGETKEFWIKIYPSLESNFKMNNNNKERF